MTAKVLAIAEKPQEIYPTALKAVQALRRRDINQNREQAPIDNARRTAELYSILQSLETIANNTEKDVNDKFPNSLLAHIVTHSTSLFTSKSSQLRTKLANTAKNIALNSDDPQSIIIAAYLLHRIDQDWIKKTYEEMVKKENSQEEDQKWRTKIFAFFASIPKASNNRITPNSINELAVSTAAVIFSHLAKGETPQQALMKGLETLQNNLPRFIIDAVDKLIPFRSPQKILPNVPRSIFFSPENTSVQGPDRVIIASNQEPVHIQPGLAM
ncbi:MAG: hypothetical protein QXO09_05965 [Candidatus Caldarchaeum sp.]